VSLGRTLQRGAQPPAFPAPRRLRHPRQSSSLRYRHSRGSKTCASRPRFVCGMFSQEVAAPTRHGLALRPLRQEATAATPSWWTGCGRLGPPAAATPVAGATNVAPHLVG
jgi:hypothetical protein